MFKKTTLLFAAVLLFVGLSSSLMAQKNENYASPKDMFELGLHGGYLFVAGDISQQPGFGGGISLRKAMDYIFSIRLDGQYGLMKGESGTGQFYRGFETTYMSGTIFGVMSLNTLRWDRPVKKSNLYFMIGVGGNFFETDYMSGADRFSQTREGTLSPHVTGGAGLAFRIGPRMNIGIEHQASSIFGSRTDLIDGFDTFGPVQDRNTIFRDIINYTCIKFNFNIGNSSTQAEPLYWLNPLDVVLDDLSEIKEKQALSLEDSDDDGVIDAIDQEPNTPPDAPVDTKGRTLDSDRDGVADYKDREPYFPPRPGERVNEEGVVINPTNPQGGVSEDRVREIIAEELQNYQLRDQSTAGGSTAVMAEWFLPMIHFGTDGANIKYSDYGTLSSIARMLKGNANLRLVVTGFADSSAPESYNEDLSYKRAQAVVDHLVNNHGIGRGRLVLQYKGESELLVPNGSSYMNRRVEFRVAQPNDVEMDPPSGANNSGSGY